MKNIKMKKISTKNILTKIFKINSKKNVKKKKISKTVTKVIKKTKAKVVKKNASIKKTKVKVVKKNLSIKKPKIKVFSAKIKNSITEKGEIKTDNLRISKSNEIKPEIIKVKKQQTEKRAYKVKDYVVYPKHGVGKSQSLKKLILVELMLRHMFLNLKKIKPMEWSQLINNLTSDLWQLLTKLTNVYLF
tara:strand:- start:62 stop:628 length:567 start_codon:yes stop_codon:yes gene_type:complete